MKQLISSLDRPLVASPGRRRWAAVALFALALWAWGLFAYTTYIYNSNPRGAPVTPERMSWKSGEWRFKTEQLSKGRIEHLLTNTKADLELSLCRDTAEACQKLLFPRARRGCVQQASDKDYLFGEKALGQAECNHLLGTDRFNGRYWVGHYGPDVGVVAFVKPERTEYLFSRPLIRPDPRQREEVLRGLGMVAMALGALCVLLRYGLARLAWTWRDSGEDAKLLAGLHERSHRWRGQAD